MGSKTAFYELMDRVRRWRRERAVRKFARVTGLSLTDSQHRLIAEIFAEAPRRPPIWRNTDGR